MSNSTFLSPNEFCSLLNISYSTFMRRIRTGEIPFVRIGKQIRIPTTYIKQLEQQAHEGDLNDK